MLAQSSNSSLVKELPGKANLASFATFESTGVRTGRQNEPMKSLTKQKTLMEHEETKF